jgi:hypothetical protein
MVPGMPQPVTVNGRSLSVALNFAAIRVFEQRFGIGINGILPWAAEKLKAGHYAEFIEKSLCAMTCLESEPLKKDDIDHMSLSEMEECGVAILVAMQLAQPAALGKLRASAESGEPAAGAQSGTGSKRPRRRR